jgi:hypothetical protein
MLPLRNWVEVFGTPRCQPGCGVSGLFQQPLCAGFYMPRQRVTDWELFYDMVFARVFACLDAEHLGATSAPHLQAAHSYFQFLSPMLADLMNAQAPSTFKENTLVMTMPMTWTLDPVHHPLFDDDDDDDDDDGDNIDDATLWPRARVRTRVMTRRAPAGGAPPPPPPPPAAHLDDAVPPVRAIDSM